MITKTEFTRSFNGKRYTLIAGFNSVPEGLNGKTNVVMGFIDNPKKERKSFVQWLLSLLPRGEWLDSIIIR